MYNCPRNALITSNMRHSRVYNIPPPSPAWKVLRAFNFSTGGGLAGVLKKTGEAPRRVFFRRRGDLRDIAGAGDTVPAGSTMNGRADNGRQVCWRDREREPHDILQGTAVY